MGDFGESEPDPQMTVIPKAWENMVAPENVVHDPGDGSLVVNGLQWWT